MSEVKGVGKIFKEIDTELLFFFLLLVILFSYNNTY